MVGPSAIGSEKGKRLRSGPPAAAMAGRMAAVGGGRGIPLGRMAISDDPARARRAARVCVIVCGVWRRGGVSHDGGAMIRGGAVSANGRYCDVLPVP